MPMELTAAQESVVIDNLEVFNMNGLHFQIDQEGIMHEYTTSAFYSNMPRCCNNSLFHDALITAAPTKRVMLIGQPVSKSWSLGPRGMLLF